MALLKSNSFKLKNDSSLALFELKHRVLTDNLRAKYLMLKNVNTLNRIVVKQSKFKNKNDTSLATSLDTTRSNGSVFNLKKPFKHFIRTDSVKINKTKLERPRIDNSTNRKNENIKVPSPKTRQLHFWTQKKSDNMSD